jgi:hypothetical protein
MKRRFTKKDLENMDFSAYLASGSESDESPEDPTMIREKYKSLLSNDNNERQQTTEEMEITFVSGLTELTSNVIQRKRERVLEKNETLWGTFLRKKKEKKKLHQKEKLTEVDMEHDDASIIDYLGQSDSYFKEALKEYEERLSEPTRKGHKKKKPSHKFVEQEIKQENEQETKTKAELELLMMNETQDGHEHFSMETMTKRDPPKKLKKHGKSLDESKDDRDVIDIFDINVMDPRFSALYESSEYAIDPTNPQ